MSGIFHCWFTLQPSQDISVQKAEALSNGKWTQERALVGTPAQVVAQIQRFVDIGVDYFMVEVLGLSDAATRELVLEEVLPHFTEIRRTG